VHNSLRAALARGFRPPRRSCSACWRPGRRRGNPGPPVKLTSRLRPCRSAPGRGGAGPSTGQCISTASSTRPRRRDWPASSSSSRSRRLPCTSTRPAGAWSPPWRSAACCASRGSARTWGGAARILESQGAACATAPVRSPTQAAPAGSWTATRCSGSTAPPIACPCPTRAHSSSASPPRPRRTSGPWASARGCSVW